MRNQMIRLHLLLHSWFSPPPADDPTRDRGQATTEYALVLLGAAVIALLIVAWATAGGGAGKIGRLFDRVMDEVTSRV